MNKQYPNKSRWNQSQCSFLLSPVCAVIFNPRGSSGTCGAPCRQRYTPTPNPTGPGFCKWIHSQHGDSPQVIHSGLLDPQSTYRSRSSGYTDCRSQAKLRTPHFYVIMWFWCNWALITQALLQGLNLKSYKVRLIHNVVCFFENKIIGNYWLVCYYSRGFFPGNAGIWSISTFASGKRIR